jgi:DNA polymerase-4
MPMAQALRLCPQAVVMRPRMEHYAAVSAQLMRILRRFSPQCEPIALDEAFLDATGAERLLGDGGAIARAIKQGVASELALCASVGVATSKFVAKVASDAGKPDGLVVVPPGQERAFLAPLPVGRILGVGRKTEPLLRAAGLRTIGDVQRASGEALRRAAGARLAGALAALAVGRDDRPVVADRDPVTIGSEETLDADTGDRELVRARLLPHADRVAERLRHHGYQTRVVQLKVKYADFTVRTRRVTLEEATTEAGVIAGAARGLLERKPDGALGHTLDAIAERFGAGALRRASRLEDDED